jgi:hypothetical protein
MVGLSVDRSGKKKKHHMHSDFFNAVKGSGRLMHSDKPLSLLFSYQPPQPRSLNLNETP